MAGKKAAAAGTPAIAALTRARMAHTLHRYEHDPGETHFGAEAAAKLGVSGSEIFKTLVVDTGAGLAVAVVPVPAMLDLKAMAATVGVKKVVLADPAVAARSSGFVVGGISPIGQRTPLPTVIDQTAATLESMMVSAGRRGLQVRLAPTDLLALTQGRFAPIS